MTENEKYWMIKGMTTYGGSFVQALARAFQCADFVNFAKLELAFPEYVKKYIDMGYKLAQREENKYGKANE